MDKFSAHQVLNSTWGELWIDGTYMAEVTAFEAKVTLEKADVNMTRRLAKAQKITFFMQQNKSDQQLQEQMNKIIEQIQPKPLNCTNHTMHPVKCKNYIYNIGICCDM